MPSGGIFAAHVTVLTPDVPVIVATGAGDLHEIAHLLIDSKFESGRGLTLMLAQRLGAPKEDWLRLELGGLLHDIGKIGVPDAILRKSGKLTEEEWVEMRRHPALGCTILSGIAALAGTADVVRSHHERWDGAGYPDGLGGEEIPWHARSRARWTTRKPSILRRLAGTHGVRDEGPANVPQ